MCERESVNKTSLNIKSTSKRRIPSTCDRGRKNQKFFVRRCPIFVTIPSEIHFKMDKMSALQLSIRRMTFGFHVYSIQSFSVTFVLLFRHWYLIRWFVVFFLSFFLGFIQPIILQKNIASKLDPMLFSIYFFRSPVFCACVIVSVAVVIRKMKRYCPISIWIFDVD